MSDVGAKCPGHSFPHFPYLFTSARCAWRDLNYDDAKAPTRSAGGPSFPSRFHLIFKGTRKNWHWVLNKLQIFLGLELKMVLNGTMPLNHIAVASKHF